MIAITDSLDAPIVEFADVVIPLVFTRNRGTIHKSPVTMSILNVLLFEVAKVIDEEGNDSSVFLENTKDYINEDY